MAKRQVIRIRPQEMSWGEALDRYITTKAAEGLREATLTDYRQKVGQFFRTYPGFWPLAIEGSLLGWLASAKAAATYNLRLGAMKLFLNWAVKRQLVSENPVAEFHMRRKPDRITDIPEDVIRELFTLPDKSTYSGSRDYALFALFLDTGLRPHEAFGLVPGDINLKTHEVNVSAELAKTGLPRALPLSDVTVRALDEFLTARPREWGANDVVFTSVFGRQLNKDSWGDIMEKYSKRLDCKIRGYDLRHLFALAFLRRGGNAFALQQIMGHKSMDMTRRYVNLVQGDIREMHDKASPVASLIPSSRKTTKISHRDRDR